MGTAFKIARELLCVTEVEICGTDFLETVLSSTSLSPFPFPLASSSRKVDLPYRHHHRQCSDYLKTQPDSPGSVHLMSFDEANSTYFHHTAATLETQSHCKLGTALDLDQNGSFHCSSSHLHNDHCSYCCPCPDMLLASDRSLAGLLPSCNLTERCCCGNGYHCCD